MQAAEYVESIRQFCSVEVFIADRGTRDERGDLRETAARAGLYTEVMSTSTAFFPRPRVPRER